MGLFVVPSTAYVYVCVYIYIQIHLPWKTLGFQFSASAYNTYVFSAMAFVAQLESPPEAVIRAEEAILFRQPQDQGSGALQKITFSCSATLAFHSISVPWRIQQRRHR